MDPGLPPNGVSPIHDDPPDTIAGADDVEAHHPPMTNGDHPVRTNLQHPAPPNLSPPHPPHNIQPPDSHHSNLGNDPPIELNQLSLDASHQPQPLPMHDIDLKDDETGDLGVAPAPAAAAGAAAIARAAASASSTQQHVHFPDDSAAAAVASPAPSADMRQYSHIDHNDSLEGSSDEIQPDAAIEGRDAMLSGRALRITLLLITGARHPYTLDERYLQSRQFAPRNAAGEVDPMELSGYQLKELIWTDWRTEWEPRPANPSGIRLIVMGRMIEDEFALKDLPFRPLQDYDVVHMTVRPADLEDADEGALPPGERRDRSRSVNEDGEERDRGCCCVIL